MLADRMTLLDRAARYRWPGRHLRGLATMLMRPKGTVAAWLSGRRNMPPEIMAIIAADFRSFGSQCVQVGWEMQHSIDDTIVVKKEKSHDRYERRRD